jgi:hypothetical protein
MTVGDHIEKLKSRRNDIETRPEMFALVEEALRAYVGITSPS